MSAPTYDIEKSHDVFISYAHQDADYDVANAKLIAEWLEGEGYDVWWDRHMLFGDFGQQLERKASNAKRVIVLWSPRADKSKYVAAECFLAANRGTLAPIIIEERKGHPLPESWGRFHHLKLTDFEKQKVDILHMLPPPSGKREATTPPADNTQISIAALPTASGILIGREAEKVLLVNAWASTAPGTKMANKTNIVVLHAIGGAGKTALMRNFIDNLADQGFAGARKVFGWSAYSQGSGDNRTVSADIFIAQALGFFGYDLGNHPIADPVERGRKLASLVGEQRNLLILDGLEPLQDAPHINGGRLKDRGLAALITSLAAQHSGLLIITSRQEMPELKAATEPRVVSRELNRLNGQEGVALLANMGVHGKRSEMEMAVEEVLGHALSLNLLGSFLNAVYGGDVNQRELLKLGELIDEDPNLIGDDTARYASRAARIIEGTIARFETLADANVETAILNLVGLFDRPAEREALDTLLEEPAIPGLTDIFQALSRQQRQRRWNVAVTRLRKMRLLNAEGHRTPTNLDAHPIVRAHFGMRLKERIPRAHQQAHSRLYDFYRYRQIPKDFRNPIAYAALAIVASFPHNQSDNQRALASGWQDSGGEIPETLRIAAPEDRKVATALISTAAFGEALKKFLPADVEGMQPCFSAVAHGCAAGLHQDAFDEVYWPRISRGKEAFIIRKLGLLNAALATLTHFFDEIWCTPEKSLRKSNQRRVLAKAGFVLRALGRLRDAVAPIEAELQANLAAHNWQAASGAAGNIAELHLTLGDTSKAVDTAQLSVTYADIGKDAFTRTRSRATLAYAMHQAGRAQEAEWLFKEAEKIQALQHPALPKLYWVRGYLYCDFLLAQIETQAVISRATDALNFYAAEGHNWLLDIALDNLSLGRAHAQVAFVSPQSNGGSDNLRKARNHLDAAVDGLRRAGAEEFIVHGLLARAIFRRQTAEFDDAAPDLAEALDMAERDGMRLHLSDYHLESARLLLTRLADGRDNALRNGAETHYATARRLIGDTSYKRRLPELEAICACLDGTIPATLLGPDRDLEGRPSLHWLS